MRRGEVKRKALWLTLKKVRISKKAAIGFILYLALSIALLYVCDIAQPIGFWYTLLFILTYCLAFALLGFWLHWRRYLGNILPKLSATRGPHEASLQHHRKQIVWQLLGIAALCDRAITESQAANGSIPEPQRELGRQRALAAARLEPVWAQLPESERNLLIADEGSWPWDDVWPRILRAEDVRVLRWVLGMDEVLRPFEFLTPDLAPVFRTTAYAEETNGTRCLAAYDLRPAQTLAQAMVTRCVAEGVARDLWQEDNEASRKALLHYAEQMRNNPANDLLIESAPVSQSSESSLRWIGQAAARRMITLEHLIDYLNGPADAPLSIPGS